MEKPKRSLAMELLCLLSTAQIDVDSIMVDLGIEHFALNRLISELSGIGIQINTHRETPRSGISHLSVDRKSWPKACKICDEYAEFYPNPI